MLASSNLSSLPSSPPSMCGVGQLDLCTAPAAELLPARQISSASRTPEQPHCVCCSLLSPRRRCLRGRPSKPAPAMPAKPCPFRDLKTAFRAFHFQLASIQSARLMGTLDRPSYTTFAKLAARLDRHCKLRASGRCCWPFNLCSLPPAEPRASTNPGVASTNAGGSKCAERFLHLGANFRSFAFLLVDLPIQRQ